MKPQRVSEITDLQTKVMIFIKHWAKVKKTPIPQKEILVYMVSKGEMSYNALNAVNALLSKGYIRRAYSEQQNRTYYVMIRNI